ncbi:hypothetical protein Bca52824_093789 [Brassica carinata]|uniref:Uncharacterized protein n=1 Tax=Brassica carinata TaxID=52824 RepID=A0A8X7P5L4_BRACI|nr:hypothetical protein Bca52824_093789 [Brassica carinata]
MCFVVEIAIPHFPRPEIDIRLDGYPADSFGLLEDLLGVMAVGNPVMQRALDARRAALGMQQPPPESTGGDSGDPTPAHDYFGTFP